MLELLEGPLARRPYQIGAPLLSRYRIDEESRAVYVLDIDHRRDIYRS